MMPVQIKEDGVAKLSYENRWTEYRVPLRDMPVQIKEDGVAKLSYENRRAEYRVPLRDIPDLEAYLWAESRRIPVLIKDASPSGVLLDISSTSRAILHGEGVLVLEISCRTMCFQMSGTVRRQTDGTMALSLFKSPVEFASDAKAARQWTGVVSWLQVEWLRKLQRLQEDAYSLEGHPEFVECPSKEFID
jgi:hypothetical protein